MRKIKVLYYGPITPKGASSKGGFAAANRKNCDMLSSMGIEVDERPKSGKLQMLMQPLKLLFEKLSRDSLIHIATPFGGLLMIPTFMLVSVARLKRIPVLLDVRAGNFVTHFQKYGVAGKTIIRAILDRASLVAVEGSSYIPQFREIIGFKGDMYYFPNLANCADLVYQKRCEDSVNIFYFGRITEDKGINVMLDVINMLDANYRLYLAGVVADDVDESRLAGNRITYLGSLTSELLKQQMAHMHIFLFPTHHVGEGQSNSLIEAMSHGLIPVVADYGFCKEVVAECGIVLPVNSDAAMYRKAIEEIAAGDMEKQGRQCIEHIKTCHNAEIEIKKLLEKYEQILNYKS